MFPSVYNQDLYIQLTHNFKHQFWSSSDLGDDFFDVQSELVPVAANWKSIGIALHLKPDVWEKIDTQYSDNPRACLTLIVKEWLKRNYNVGRFGEPTWQRLVEAVGHPAGGGNMEVARRIAMKHMVERISSRYTVFVLNRTS